MTETADGARQRAASATDPFVTQVRWLIAAAGGKDQLVQRCGGLVSARTLDNWMAGSYPRTKVTGAVRELDAWACGQMPGYPTAAGAPTLVDACGPYRGVTTAAAEEAEEAAEPAEPTADPVGPAPRPRPGWGRRALWVAAALVAAVAVAVVLTTLAVRRDGAEAAAAAAAAAAADSTAAANSLVNLPLPSTGDGSLYTELSGSIGANTFGDPRTLQERGTPIPPNTELQVRCRYYAPSVPSVTPDGFWYLIETEPWNGLWTPANSFMNGDLPGGPYVHNTDFAVPVCQ